MGSNACTRLLAAMRPLRAIVAVIATLTVLSGALAASNVVEYTYDRVGNITQIKRQAAPGFAITSFDPPSGAVGTAVTVYGTGFSATPSANAVTFNGAAAAVSASDAGSISTTVPAGATTGRISVTVGAATVYSVNDFVVTVPGVPVIASFAPSSGESGTSVSVTGSNFDPAAGATTVKLNGVTATSTVASASSLSFSVPAAVASGRVTATTAAGTGMSAADFIVPPAGVAASAIASIGRIQAGGPAFNVAVGSPNTHAVVLFDGSSGGYYTLQFGQLAITPSSAAAAYKIIKPDNTTLVTGSISLSGGYAPTVHLPVLSGAGTYTVLLSPGLATLNTNVRLVADSTVTTDGAALALSTDTAGQSVRAVFAGVAGQRLGLGVTGVLLSPATGTLTVTGYNPDGSQMAGAATTCFVASAGNPQANCDGELAPSVSGTHTLVAKPSTAATMSFGLQLSTEATATLAYDTPATVTLSRVGQDARYSFAGAAGDSLGMTIAGIAASPQAQSFATTVFRPDGSTFITTSVTQPSGLYVELGTLATAGNYGIFIDPAYGAHGTARIAVAQGTVLAPTDAAATFGPSYAAEATRFRFAGTAGQNLAIGMGSATYVSGTGAATLSVYKPDRTQLSYSASCNPAVYGGRCKLNLTNLPVTGTYSVAVAPPAGVQMNGQVALTADMTGSLTAGSPQAISATRIAQNARYTFALTSGDSTAVKLYGASTTPAALPHSLTLYRPDGTQLSTASVSSGSAILNIAGAPVTGTYTALVETASGAPWQGTLALDPGALVAVDGATVNLGGATEEPLRYRFSGTAGQRLELGIGGFAGTGGAATPVTVYRPDGSSAGGTSCFTANAGTCEVTISSLPATGTYSVVAIPPAATSITAGTLALSSPVIGTFTIGASAETVSISRHGQTARYTFSGTSAQLLRLNWSGTAVSAGSTVTVSVLKPDGTTLSSSSFGNTATGGFDIASLPSTGTYTVTLDPSSGGTLSAAVSLVTR